MLRLVSHLESLLMLHDCVVVPKFGGFVLQRVPALYRKDEHFFCPMHKEIVFNTTLKHNDGLLSESYMQKYQVEYPKACRMIEDDVDEIKNLLYKGLKVPFGVLGSFNTGKERQIIFTASETNPFSTESYGLTSFHLPTLESLQREEVALLTRENKAKDIFYIPVNRRIIRGITAAAAAVALFLFVSTPVKEIDTTAYTASFIPTAIVTGNIPVASLQEDVTAETSLPSLRPANEVKPSVTTVTNKPRQQAKEETPLYYVVVSSVNTQKKADAFIKQMDRSVFKRADKLVEAKKVRVYADKFTSREKADAYMAKLRKNPKYSDAWVYVP